MASTLFRAMSVVAVAAGLMMGGYFTNAQAAKLPPLDPKWTDQCVGLHKGTKNLASTVRNYCACVQEIIGNEQKFETLSELEHSYPPVHRSCWRKSGMRGT